jgi:SAM-dependent methyltransferase
MSNKSDAPSNSAEFDKVYNSSFAHWMWSDFRIPKELKDLIKTNNPKTSLELGCGLGRYSSYMAKLGIKATAVDFSPIAIDKAKKRVAKDECKPVYMVGNVTNLESIIGQHDVSFDVGCFHCLKEEGQKKYVSEIFRLLKPGATHLFWALNDSPSHIKLYPDYIANVFETRFQLINSKFSRRRIVGSHWYWLVRAK